MSKVNDRIQTVRADAQNRVGALEAEAGAKIRGLEASKGAAELLANLAGEFKKMGSAERKAAFEGLSLHDDESVRRLGSALKNLIDPEPANP